MNKKYSKKYLIETGAGLQNVDNLKISTYFKEQSQKYIKGEISVEELNNFITSYYKNKSNNNDRSEEADKVSVRISILLSDDSFTFTVGQLLSIHKFLFDGLIDNAGKLREYNFSKKEWVLNGQSVSYGDYRELEMALQYDFDIERKFDYTRLSINEIIDHLAIFVSNLWQIHAFEEGNTRTTAIFFIKYLRTLGFDVNNDTFAKNSWYFRNALVRANYQNLSQGIYHERKYLILFLKNLLLGEKNKLENKELNISFNEYSFTVGNSKLNSLILSKIKENPKITTTQLAEELNVSPRTIKTHISELINKKLIKRMNGKKYGYWKFTN